MAQNGNDNGTLSLEDLATQFNVQDAISMRKQYLSEKIAGDILRLFKTSVIATVIVTFVLAFIDAYMIVQNTISPADRLVNERVLLAIIGATLIELGGAMAAIVWSMFAKPRSDAQPAENDSVG